MKKKLIILVILFMILLTIILEIPRIEPNLEHASGEKSNITNVIRLFFKR